MLKDFLDSTNGRGATDPDITERDFGNGGRGMLLRFAHTGQFLWSFIDGSTDTMGERYMDVAFEAFGEDRLMFGSDWPVCLLAASYEQVFGIAQK